MLKRQNLLSIVGLLVLCVLSIYLLYTKQQVNKKAEFNPSTFVSELKPETVIMSSMGNQTERAELGRATWKFLHTMMARFPEKPTPEERQSLQNFMVLFSTLYPCGECAQHFQKLITTYPPQTSSRFAASQWLCSMHNKVNERLKKPIYDCTSIEENYPCGCADEV